ncbi:MAG: alanine racemase, partial [Candidatus Omnitrophica bacterium]|nr:alanine racemase [Candidatus Omnitrophota bacterium]
LTVKPVLSFKTRVAYLKQVGSGRWISYGRTYITRAPTRIATLPVGYADGYPRLLSNKAQVLIRGQCAPVIGRVCMDQVMVDVGNIRGVRVGDEVVLIGRQARGCIAAEDIAALCRTIPYEITCGIAARVRRLVKPFFSCK